MGTCKYIVVTFSGCGLVGPVSPLLHCMVGLEMRSLYLSVGVTRDLIIVSPVSVSPSVAVDSLHWSCISPSRYGFLGRVSECALVGPSFWVWT